MARSALLPTVHPVYLCTTVGPQGLLVVRLPAPFIPHSASLGPPWQRESSLPRLPISAPPTGLDGCLFFIYLVLHFLSVGFSVISGCARRRSVSTYAAILVLVLIGLLFIHTVCDWTNMVITIKQTSATRVLSFLFDFSP